MTWTGERLSELATGYWQSQALMTAVKAGVLAALPGTVDEVAARTGRDGRLTGMLLEALVAMGVVVRAGAVLALEPSAGEFLGTGASKPLEAALMLNGSMYELWGKLPETVKSGRPALPPGAHLGMDAARTRGFVMGMHGRALSLLEPVAEAMDLAGVQTLLDVGAGPATLTRMLCERWPGLEATAMDLPGISAVARELTGGSPVARQMRHVEGSYLSDALPTGFDAVVYCGALHQHSEEQAPAILRKVVSAVRPGGKVVVVDLMLAEDRNGPVFSALFGLNMALVSGTARVYTPGEVRGMLESLGVRELMSGEIRGGIYQMVWGRA